ncbi:hypothetical protein VNO77_20326 [Canavalia gladiata]|uniref:Uncharacterized protein n=1 Tax=Canavalia gladiata TaxID=3824 RepID=A0AAN9QLC0_CANGL
MPLFQIGRLTRRHRKKGAFEVVVARGPCITPTATPVVLGALASCLSGLGLVVLLRLLTKFPNGSLFPLNSLYSTTDSECFCADSGREFPIFVSSGPLRWLEQYRFLFYFPHMMNHGALTPSCIFVSVSIRRLFSVVPPMEVALGVRLSLQEALERSSPSHHVPGLAVFGSEKGHIENQKILRLD